MKIGVLALQGDFIEHQHMLENLGCEVVQVRLPEQLAGLQGLIIPGGESTTIGKLATAYKLMAPLCTFGKKHALWGTCAGAIFISNDTQRDQPLLKLMDIKVERNAFGRQVDSFELDLNVPVLTAGLERESSIPCRLHPRPVDRLGGRKSRDPFLAPQRQNRRCTAGKTAGNFVSS